jgi:two-component system osmolarity sensor histidine kinase EnvZ
MRMLRRQWRRLRFFVRSQWPRRHDLLPKSLFGRSFLIIVTPMAILQLVLAFVFYERHWETVTRRLANALANEVQVLTVLMAGQASDDYIPRQVQSLAGIMEIQLSLSAGADITSNRSYNKTERLVEKALQEHLLYPVNIDIDRDAKQLNIWIPWGERVLRIQASQERVLSSTTYIFILWMVGTAVLVVTISVLFMRNQVKPLKQLAKVADDVGRGIDLPALRPSGALEVRQVTVAFNRMRDRLQRQVTGRMEILRNVSHDLRTPLTRMRLIIAGLPLGQQQNDLRQEISEMNQMIEGYLAFVRGEAEETLQPIFLNDWLQEMAQSFSLPDRMIKVRQPKQSVQFSIRPQAVRRAVGNLLTNALRYGQQVRLSAQIKSDEVWIVVEDDGPGIPADKRANVFQPFQRLEPSRNQATGGYGLGMTIALDLIRQHGGDILLSESVLGGLKATIKLPR